MSDIEKIKRHLSRPIPITIINSDGNEDIFYFKPLNIEQQAIMMELSKGFNSRDEIEIEGQKVPDVTKEDMKEMELLLIDVVQNSLGEVDEKTIKDFVNTNFNQLSNKLIDLIPQNQNKDLKALKKVKERIQSGQ